MFTNYEVLKTALFDNRVLWLSLIAKKNMIGTSLGSFYSMSPDYDILRVEPTLSVDIVMEFFT